MAVAVGALWGCQEAPVGPAAPARPSSPAPSLFPTRSQLEDAHRSRVVRDVEGVLSALPGVAGARVFVARPDAPVPAVVVVDAHAPASVPVDEVRALVRTAVFDGRDVPVRIFVHPRPVDLPWWRQHHGVRGILVVVLTMVGLAGGAMTTWGIMRRRRKRESTA